MIATPERTLGVRRILISAASCFALLTSLTCKGSPVAPEVGPVEGLTARFNGLNVTLVQYNPSWYPRDDSPAPGLHEVFLTALLEVRNESNTVRSVQMTDFRLQIIPHSAVERQQLFWPTIESGRMPRLPDGDLPPGEVLHGWVTFRVPQIQYSDPRIWFDRTADKVVWQPNPRIMFPITLPEGGGLMPDYHALIFGKVTDRRGEPLRDASVELTFLDPFLGPSPSLHEHCYGEDYWTTMSPTDENGWYKAMLSLRPDAFCVIARATPPAVRPDLSPADTSGLWMKPGNDEALEIETPELRIDLQLTGP